MGGDVEVGERRRNDGGFGDEFGGESEVGSRVGEVAGKRDEGVNENGEHLLEHVEIASLDASREERCQFSAREGKMVEEVLTVIRDQSVSRPSSFSSRQLQRSEALPVQRRSVSDDSELPDLVLTKIVDPELSVVSNLDELVRVRPCECREKRKRTRRDDQLNRLVDFPSFFSGLSHR